MKLKGYAMALLSALAFSIFSVFGKPFLTDIHPELAAGLAYLSAGVVLLVIYLFREKRLQIPKFGKDTKLLVVSMLLGSMAAPSLFFYGLKLIPAATTAFLSNSEILFTIILAALFFHEKLKRKALLPIAVVFLGAILVTTNGDLNLQETHLLGAFLVLVSCFFWALDNNLVRKLVQSIGLVEFTLVKTMSGGLVLTLLAVLVNSSFSPQAAAVFMLLGVLLAISIVSYFLALREIGASMTISVYSVYSIFGAALAVFYLGETVSLLQLAAGLIMLAGVFFLARS